MPCHLLGWKLTIRTVLAVFTVIRELTARAGALLVQTATHALANRTQQTDAARLGLIGALHAGTVRRYLFGKVGGYVTPWGTIGFSPVKRHPECGATGTAVQTGRMVAHFIAILMLLRSAFFTPRRVAAQEPGDSAPNFIL